MDSEAAFWFHLITTFCAALLGGAVVFLAAIFCFPAVFRLAEAMHRNKEKFKHFFDVD